MKVTLHRRTCFEVKVGGHSAGLFLQDGSEWNGMAELRGIKGGAVLVVTAPAGGILHALDAAFDLGRDVAVITASPQLIATLQELHARPDPATLEVNSWRVERPAA